MGFVVANAPFEGLPGWKQKIAKKKLEEKKKKAEEEEKKRAKEREKEEKFEKLPDWKKKVNKNKTQNCFNMVALFCMDRLFVAKWR